MIPLIAKGRAEAEYRGRRHQLLLRDRQRHEQARGRLRGSTEHGWWHAARDSTTRSSATQWLLRTSGITPLPHTTASRGTSTWMVLTMAPLPSIEWRTQPPSVITSFGTSSTPAPRSPRPASSQGQIDEARIWNNARTPAQIADIDEPGGRIPDDRTARPLGRERGYRYGIRRRFGQCDRWHGASPRRRGWRARLRSTRPLPVANASLAFNGLNQYVDMGTAAGLNTRVLDR